MDTERWPQTPHDEMKNLYERLLAAERELRKLLPNKGDDLKEKDRHISELLMQAGVRTSEYWGWTAARRAEETHEYLANVPKLVERMETELRWLQDRAQGHSKSEI